MKKLFIMMLAVALSTILPTILHAQVCSVKIPIVGTETQKINAIKSALVTYAAQCAGHMQDGNCEVCFDMAELSLKNTHIATLPSGFVFNANQGVDIYVTGLKLRDESWAQASALLNIKNSGTGRVILTDTSLADVKNGIAMQAGSGTVGEIQLGHSSPLIIAGKKTGICIDVKASNTILSGVNVSNCDKGVLVEADGVRIQDKSVIKENKVGVEFKNGIKGSAITEALVYLNDDGDETNLPWNDAIRLEGDIDPAAFALAGGKVLRPAYYDVEGSDVVPVDDDPTVTTPYVFKGKRANILVDDLTEYFKTSPNSIEVRFFGSESGDCTGFVWGQSCAYTALGAPLSVTISAANFDEGKPVTVAIPDEFADKALAVLYEDSEMGTLGFSRPFKVSPGGIVAFVATPYDIPTTSGETDDSGDSNSAGNTAGDSMGGGENTMSEGGGEGLVEAAGPGAKCTLTPHANPGWLSGAVDLLWVLLILGTFGASRLLPAPARIAQRLRRRK